MRGSREVSLHLDSIHPELGDTVVPVGDGLAVSLKDCFGQGRRMIQIPESVGGCWAPKAPRIIDTCKLLGGSQGGCDIWSRCCIYWWREAFGLRAKAKIFSLKRDERG